MKTLLHILIVQCSTILPFGNKTRCIHLALIFKNVEILQSCWKGCSKSNHLKRHSGEHVLSVLSVSVTLFGALKSIYNIYIPDPYSGDLHLCFVASSHIYIHMAICIMAMYAKAGWEGCDGLWMVQLPNLSEGTASDLIKRLSTRKNPQYPPRPPLE